MAMGGSDPVRTFSSDAILPEYAYVGDNAVSISEHSCRQCYLVVGHTRTPLQVSALLKWAGEMHYYVVKESLFFHSQS